MPYLRTMCIYCETEAYSEMSLGMITMDQSIYTTFQKFEVPKIFFLIKVTVNTFIILQKINKYWSFELFYLSQNIEKCESLKYHGFKQLFF